MTRSKDPIVVVTKKVLKNDINKEPNITRRRGWTDAALLSNFGNIPTIVTGLEIYPILILRMKRYL